MRDSKVKTAYGKIDKPADRGEAMGHQLSNYLKQKMSEKASSKN